MSKAQTAIAPGACILHGFASAVASLLLDDISRVVKQAALRQMETRRGFRMAAEISNCGQFGWISDRHGYRYASHDPLDGRPWPTMPEHFRQLAADAAGTAGYPHFIPDVCLINRYAPGAGMGLHRDSDEADMTQPIVSVSLGVPALFQFGGARRDEPVTVWLLQHGDVVVWGGPSRLCYHGIRPLKLASHALTGQFRYNLTLRRAAGLIPAQR